MSIKKNLNIVAQKFAMDLIEAFSKASVEDLRELRKSIEPEAVKITSKPNPKAKKAPAKKAPVKKKVKAKAAPPVAVAQTPEEVQASENAHVMKAISQLHPKHGPYLALGPASTWGKA